MLNFNIFLSFCSKFQNHFYPITYYSVTHKTDKPDFLIFTQVTDKNTELKSLTSFESCFQVDPKLFSNTVWIQHPTSNQQLIHLTTLSSTSHFTILSTRISWKAVRIMMKSIYLKKSVKLEVYQNRDWG